MFTDRVSIIIGDRNPHHNVLEKAVMIIKDTYNREFTVNDLIFLDSFSPGEKEYLRNMFSNNITQVYSWEHSFSLEKDIWKYKESDYDYKKAIRDILVLLNTSTTSIGEIVYTNDYQLIENIWHGWLNLLDYETRWVLYEYNYFDEKEFIEFVCHNLKSRIGDSCIFNFEFLKTFLEAKNDYHTYNTQKILDAALGIKKAPS